MSFPLCKQLGLLVSDSGLIYGDKLEEVLRQSIPVLMTNYRHDLIRLDANWAKDYLDALSLDAKLAKGMLINIRSVKSWKD